MHQRKLLCVAAAVLLCAHAPQAEVGIASWYGDVDELETASGETLDPLAWTCAHRTLPFGTRVRVVDLKNGNSVTCRINDRGPCASAKCRKDHPDLAARVIDVSIGAAFELWGPKWKEIGLARVRVEPL